jgi:hypothetical protein
MYSYSEVSNWSSECPSASRLASKALYHQRMQLVGLWRDMFVTFASAAISLSRVAGSEL